MCFFNSILLIGKGSIECANCKRMRPGRFVTIWFDRSIERPYGLVIKVIQKVPEQTQIKTRALWEAERLSEVLGQLIFRVFTQLHMQHGVRVHRGKMKTAFEL